MRLHVCLLSLCLASTTLAQDKVRVAELSPRAEAAIDRGLKYLVKNQNSDGSWGSDHQVANTALALMAFMVKGQFPEREPNGEALSRGVDWLLKTARISPHGYLGKSMYEHGLAMLALCEVWGESSRSDEIRDAIKKGVAVIVKSQSTAGGWRYQPTGTDADMSITVMQIMALASAKEAGILVDDRTIERAIHYVKACQNRNGGFGYRGPNDPGFARTAAGVMSLLMCGDRKSPEVERGLEYLLRYPDRFNTRMQWFHYGHYYAVQAMYQAGEKYYQPWYPQIRDALVNTQGGDGSWAGRGASDYVTPMAILTLGVPYRFLPIYQR